MFNPVRKGDKLHIASKKLYHHNDAKMIGQTFGQLTVIGRMNDRSAATYLCQCTCGNFKIVTATHLKRGQVKSCGCTIFQTAQLDKEIIGTKYGRLTPIQRVNDTGQAQYLCQCDCGNTATVYGKNLKSGQTKSCGCLRKENAKNHLQHNTKRL